MKNKKGWIRILEATIAIMLVSGVLLVMYSRSVDKTDISERVYSLQREVLMDIALDSGLRQNALDDDQGSLNEFADTKIPEAFSFRVRLCDLGVACKLNITDVRDTRDKDVFVEDIVIAGEHDEYDPKKVRLFVWEQSREITPPAPGSSPDPHDAYLVVDGLVSGDWNLLEVSGTDASISGGVLTLVDNGAANVDSDSRAIYNKGGSGTDFAKGFFVSEFIFERTDSNTFSASFLVLVDKSGTKIKTSTPLQLTDGTLGVDSSNFMIKLPQSGDVYADSLVNVARNTKYGVQFIFDSDGTGDASISIDTDLDGIYDDGSAFTSASAPPTERGFTPRFDSFSGGATIEISDIKVYAYPDKATYDAL